MKARNAEFLMHVYFKCVKLMNFKIKKKLPPKVFQKLLTSQFILECYSYGRHSTKHVCHLLTKSLKYLEFAEK